LATSTGAPPPPVRLPRVGHPPHPGDLLHRRSFPTGTPLPPVTSSTPARSSTRGGPPPPRRSPPPSAPSLPAAPSTVVPIHPGALLYPGALLHPSDLLHPWRPSSTSAPSLPAAPSTVVPIHPEALLYPGALLHPSDLLHPWRPPSPRCPSTMARSSTCGGPPPPRHPFPRVWLLPAGIHKIDSVDMASPQHPANASQNQSLSRFLNLDEPSALSNSKYHAMSLREASLADDCSLNFRNETVAEISRKIVEAHEEASQGSYQPIREEDELTSALGTKEHPGRARGIRVVPWKAAFSEDAAIYHKCRHTRQSTSLDAHIDAHVQELVQERMKEQQEAWQKSIWDLERRFMQQREEAVPTSNGPQIQSPDGALKSSQASASHADIGDTAKQPVDEIKEPTRFTLHVPTTGTMIKVAEGQAWPCTEGQVLHNRPLPKGYARVSVDNVVPGSRNVTLDIPGEDEKARLGENLGTFVAWNARGIMDVLADMRNCFSLSGEKTRQ
ncbi:hypothetical protein BAE44_0016859, partial [Dichanthelium oligosanthes]